MTESSTSTDSIIELLSAFQAQPPTDLREKVLALVPVWESLRSLGGSLLPNEIRNSARDRLLYYFQQYPETVLSRHELEIVAGIGEWARRIRELRVEYGWPIISGVTALEISEADDNSENEPIPFSKMKPSDYVLLSTGQDREAAYRWRVAKDIRSGRGGVKSKILAFLKENVGKPVSGEELRYVAKDKTEWARRTRELRTEDGWPISTYWSGRPELKSGMYLLEEDRQLPPHDRDIPDSVRVEVLTRDNYSCVECGWNRSQWTKDDPRHLELHHKTHHADGGDNSADNLVTVCRICHDRIHAKN